MTLKPPIGCGPSRSTALEPSRRRLPDLSGFLLINPRSGNGGPSADELCAEAERRGIEARILRENDEPAELAGSMEARALGIAGGDGSLAPVAAVAPERDVPFVCVPFGTLNNVSLGAYAALVHHRESGRRRRHAFARLRALLMTLRDPEPLGLTLDGDPADAQLAVVSNNDYTLDLFSLGERERLDEGSLHLYLAAGWRFSEWEERTVSSLTIDAARHRIKAAVDGEPAAFETPLEFRIEPLALRVLVPRAPG